MRRLGMLAAAGVLVLGLALPALAQAPALSVTFGGEMRVHGFAFENIKDFTDKIDDEERFYFQRWRFRTTVESADKKARAVWYAEIGDLTWGKGGGPSPEYGGQGGARIGPGQGAELGADGVNVETKNLYVQFDIPGIKDSNLLLGAHNIVFMNAPQGGLMDDDAFGIQFNWKADPVDLQLYTAKLNEGQNFDSDDNDMYVARLGFNVTKDFRVTAEGMWIMLDCVGPSTGNACVDGDAYWLGGTAEAKVAGMTLHGDVVFGSRDHEGPAGSNTTFSEEGWAVAGTAQIPIQPLTIWAHGWYTSGDDTVGPSDGTHNFRLARDSDRFPVPIGGASWFSVPFVAEWVFGTRTLGVPAVGQTLYATPSGTYGLGGSVLWTAMQGLQLGGGAAWVGASDAPHQPVPGSGFGDGVIEFDVGALYSYNANLSFQAIASYLEPDAGDNAWALGWRTRFAF